MATQAVTGTSVAPDVDEQFLALICSDGALLRAEFDAIIAGEWPDPPASTPGCGFIARQPTTGARRAVVPLAGLPARLRHPGIGGWVRQRSPPPRASTAERKGR